MLAIYDIHNSTNSKSINVYHGYAPKNIKKGKGVYLYDQNDNMFLDCGMALGSVSLGYAYDEIDEFVIKTIKDGINFSRPSHLEEELTNLINRDLYNTNYICRYSKSSSMLLSVIPRIARYFTKKKLIAYPKYSFLGNTDWYLCNTTNAGGILIEIKNSTIVFDTKNDEALLELFNCYAKDLACIIMEPLRYEIENKKFYSLLHSLCTKNNVLLVFDETITGYRFHYPLAQNKINCIPHMTIVGKAFANGYALSALIGMQDLMCQIEQESIAGNIFDFSTTHAGETIGLAAAIKTLNIYRKEQVVSKLHQKGKYLYNLIKKVLDNYSLNEIFTITGHYTYFKLQCTTQKLNKTIMQALCKFFFNKKILFRGTFSVSISHKQQDLDQIIESFSDFCKKLNNVADSI